MQQHPVYKRAEVYGVSRDVPVNYVARKAVDDQFIANLTRDKHVILYGSSKQGKTSLRKSCLKESDYVVVQCSNRWTLKDLHEGILKRAGYELTTSTVRTTGGAFKITATFPGGPEVEAGQEQSTAISSCELQIDTTDVNDVISALNSIHFKKFIVLEDFHYLEQDTQRDFSVALKAFHEASKICFIIVGVWQEQNRLISFNGDLTGRVVSIDVDIWKPEELDEVITLGEKLLNVQFPSGFKANLVALSRGSVYVVQEACLQACTEAGIVETRTPLQTPALKTSVADLVANVIHSQSSRYERFVNEFAEGFQATELEMHKWILFTVLTAPPAFLTKGLTYKDIREKLHKFHPHGSGLNAGNLTLALQSSANLQVKKGITPIILDYDLTARRLCIVDRGFFIWLETQDTVAILARMSLPVP